MKQRETSIPLQAKARIRDAIDRLVQLYDRTGHAEQAAEWKKKLEQFDQARDTKRL